MGGINSFDILEGSNLLVSTGQDRKITYWDLRDSNPQQTFNTNSKSEYAEECFNLCFLPDQSKFFTSGTENIVKLWVTFVKLNFSYFLQGFEVTNSK
jgi:cilia- and flagella-associated protein 52